RSHFGKRIAPLHVPIGTQSDFKGVVNVATGEAYTFANGKAEKATVPADLADQIASYRDQLVESAVESDDELMMKYLEGEEISNEELQIAIKTGVAQGTLVPVVAGAASKNIGVATLLDAVVEYFPSAAEAEATAPGKPGHLAALVFKTIIDPQ